MNNKKDFYVYEHWRPDKGECFYVGKGQGDRAYYMKRRSKHHKNVVSKLEAMGMCAEIVLFASGLTEQEAFEIEKSRISHYRGMGIRLANKTDGGEGVVGYKHTTESKAKMSAKSLGHPPTSGTTGMKFSEETRAKMSAAAKGKTKSKEHAAKVGLAHRGKIISVEARAKMSEAAKRRSLTEEGKLNLIKAGKKGAAIKWGIEQ